MDREQMISRYEELYDKMKDSKDVKNMKIFGEAATYYFKEMAKMHPEMAMSWLSHLEAMCWDNFLSETEAVNIGKTMVNEDGLKGFHWGHDTFVSAVKQLGGVPEEKPSYNSYALCVTANMIYSDLSHIFFHNQNRQLNIPLIHFYLYHLLLLFLLFFPFHYDTY